MDTVYFLLHQGKIFARYKQHFRAIVFEADRFAESAHRQELRTSLLLLDRSRLSGLLTSQIEADRIVEHAVN